MAREQLPSAGWLSSYAFATLEGGFAILMTNDTGAPSVKGTVVTTSDSADNAFKLIVKDAPTPIGVVYEEGIPSGELCAVVVTGMADVLFVASTTKGHMARGFLTLDGDSYVPGWAMSEAHPAPPFDEEKHSYEIGHLSTARVGAGLSRVVLHFN